MATTVSSGSSQSALIVSSGVANELTVLSGGTIVGFSILSGGIAIVSGTDSGSTISSGGSETVLGSAIGDQVYGTQIVSAGTAIAFNETVFSGGAIDLFVAGVTASGITVSSGGTLNINGHATASNTTMDNGTLTLQTAKSVVSGGLVLSGANVIDITGNMSAGYGDVAVISGFGAGDVIDITAATTIGAAATHSVTSAIVSGTTVITVSGGGASDAFIFSGTSIGANLGLLTDGAGGVELVDTAAASGTYVISGGATSANIVVASGGFASVLSGGTMSAANILSGGSANVQAGGLDSATSIAAGAQETVSGTARADQVVGTQVVSGASAMVGGETVQSGGVVSLVASGAAASGLTISSGGTLTLSGTTTATNTVINGGSVVLQSAQATLSGSLTFNGAGSLVISAAPGVGAGNEAVISGFYTGDKVDLAYIGSGATLSATTSGGLTIATVTSGGTSATVDFASSVGSASLSLGTDGNGGEQITYSAAAIPTTTAYTPGDLVLSIYGNGANTGAYTLDQAAPIVLEEITTTGAVVSEQVLPQATTVVNGVTQYAISGEYQSASEGLLTLAANGQSLTILGYGVTATAFDASNAQTVFGTTALGQTTSLTSAKVTPVARVVADISYNGVINTSTALTNVFNTNNPRSVYTVNGTTFYLSGQGNGADGTQGVFTADVGANTATAIYNTLTDTRDVSIVGNQLYVSIDSKLNGGGGLYVFGTSLPTSATTPTEVPGVGSSVMLTAATANSVNSSAIGTAVNLSPEQYFFANATTLYIADGGVPKEGGIGDGGLQKWSLVGGTWVLDYTLSQGLNMVPGTATTGTTGLIGMTGTVVGGNVIVYASNETAAETDQTYLYGITDTLAATTLPVGESFTVLETAAPDTLIRGVSFAPTASATLPQVTSAITVSSGVTSSGLTFGSGGSAIVVSGGTLAGATLLSGASATISAGGLDSGAVIANGGTEMLFGSASADWIAGVQIISNGAAVATGETIANGGTLDLFIASATANSTTVLSGGVFNVSGHAYADNTVISGGVLNLQSPKGVISAALTFVGNSGTIEVTSVTSVGYGDLAVITGFGATDVIDERVMGSATALATSTVSGNTIATFSSGAVSESFTLAGTSYGSGLALVADGLGGMELTYTPPAPVVITVSSGVTSTGLSVSGGANLNVLSGGTISAIQVLSGGSATISAGAVDSGSTIAAGGFETVSGSANGDKVYGIQDVTSGPVGGSVAATISNETVYAGGTIELYLKPDIGTNITVASGGLLLLSGNVSGTNVTLDGGALMELQSPKATLSGSLVFSGAASLEFTSVTSAGYGDYAVISGFGAGDVIDETVIGAGATLSTSVTAGNTVATITSGGISENFTFAGTAHLSLVSDGGTGVELVTSALQTIPTDFNNDGKSDLLWQSTDGTIAAWEMNGATILSGSVINDPGTNWHVDGTGDFTASGTTDILLQGNDGSVGVWQMNGLALASGAVIADPGTGWHVEGSGVFNATGTADIVLQADDGSVALWQTNGTTVTASNVIGDPGSNWHVVGTGNFNGTGTADIVLQDNAGDVALWQTNGTTLTASNVIAQPGAGWDVAATGVFNGNQDMVLQNQNGSVALWQINGGTVASGAVLGNPGSAWHVLSVGDYNGDGNSAILFQNNAGQDMSWEINGTTIANTATLGAVPVNWQTIGQGTTNFVNGTASTGTLAGSALNDEFVFTSSTAGSHVITGFDPMNDMLQLSAAQFTNYAGVQADTNTLSGSAVIDLGGGSTLTLQGVLPSQLSARNFQLG